jgi:chromosome segregation ATPase
LTFFAAFLLPAGCLRADSCL